jgi:hypothetical protein
MHRPRRPASIAVMDWVKAIGFQHEVVHTGALHHLFSLPGGAGVARALTGDETIEHVGEPRKEVKLRPGSRRRVDLGAEITCGDSAGCLGVEVKADSTWTRKQLKDTVPEGGHGVLLAVGYMALAVGDRDMQAITGYAWPWRVVRPDGFADIVREHAEGDLELLSYAGHLASEADDHRRAVDAVQRGSEVSWGRNSEALGDWAYFGEVIQHRRDPWKWDREWERSGALMKLWVGPDKSLVQFVGERGHRRSLCVKAWNPGGPIQQHYRRLVERLEGIGEEHGWRQETPRMPSPRSGSCAAARFPLQGRTPEEAAEFVDPLVSRLEGSS